jgi:hypothetical protein
LRIVIARGPIHIRTLLLWQSAQMGCCDDVHSTMELESDLNPLSSVL